jgi:serine/threonine protein kinase
MFARKDFTGENIEKFICLFSGQVLIIVEYVPGGNLKDYLLNTRCKGKDIYENLAPYSATLTSKDLLTFGYEIARGMSHLEQIKVSSRDQMSILNIH